MFKALLVDDREIFVEELKRCDVWGETSGFCCAGRAANGMEALERLREDSYDLVITDIRMPKVDGIELLQEIKKQALCPCVVLASEYREFSYAREGLVLGAFDYLVKPVDAESLRSLLHRVAYYLREQSAPARESRSPDIPLCAKRLVDAVLASGEEADAAAGEIVNELSAFYPGRLVDTLAALGRVMDHTVSEIWKRCGWMKRFYRMELFKPDAARQFSGPESCRALFQANVRQLSASVRRFQPLDSRTTIGRVCLYMLEHPEDDISLKAMASLFYINRSYLSNMFRKKTGLYFMEYCTVIRMERARYLLETEDIRIYEVCLRLGYHDQEYFSKLFKKTVGVSPVALRHAGQNRNAG